MWGTDFSVFRNMLPARPDDEDESDVESILMGTSHIRMDSKAVYYIRRKFQTMFGTFGTIHYIVRNKVLVGGRWTDEYISQADLATTINLIVKKYAMPSGCVENGVETANPNLSDVKRKLVSQMTGRLATEKSHVIWTDGIGNQIHLSLRISSGNSADLIVEYLSKHWLIRLNGIEDY